MVMCYPARCMYVGSWSPLPAGTLKQWSVTNNDLFYVFVRREDQPDSPSPQGLFPLDHNSGKGVLHHGDALQYRWF